MRRRGPSAATVSRLRWLTESGSGVGEDGQCGAADETGGQQVDDSAAPAQDDFVEAVGQNGGGARNEVAAHPEHDRAADGFVDLEGETGLVGVGLVPGGGLGQGQA
ncbi:hypothetical protein Rwratislav_36304 [Rhodococcus wratislaviensis IFP 2016]|nr:hypothetical protein Rwratislav_36304 [Rhodococcus wratislaviensis IFP 2016]